MYNSKLRHRMLFYRLCEAHRELVRNGKLDEANSLLHLLRWKTITFGLDPRGCSSEITLENLGLTPTYSRDYNRARFHIPDHR